MFTSKIHKLLDEALESNGKLYNSLKMVKSKET